MLDGALEAGARVGRFVIVRPLGEGGMGMVYEARDPELERSVALKLLRGKSPELAMRLLREAQVLAQLQHPNVVAVHALDLHDDQVFIAMELVDGETLDKHIARVSPSWRGIVALFLQAGRGLVAAHAKAIVHRDVKLSNILVDASGRVRVGDFGLALQVTDEPEPASEPLAVDRASAVTASGVTASGHTSDVSWNSPREVNLVGARLTRAGAVLGTPFFMSPEQLRGKPATAASDQFSFCVALWFALFGDHPFAIDTKNAVIDGKRREGPARGAPRWLVRALDRGLAVDPADRYPSMGALLDVLESQPRRRQRLAIGVAGALALSGGVVAFAFARREVEPCPVPETPPVWSAARRAELKAKIAAVDPKQGESRLAIATRTVDGFLASWREAHVAACRATHVTGVQSDSLLDARMRCLDYRITELDTSLAIVATAADPVALDTAIGALVELTPITTCADPDHLAVEVAAPLPPGPRAKADAMMKQLAEIEAKLRAERIEDLPAQAAAIVKSARELGHAPTLTEALVTLARMELIAGRVQAGETALRELTQVAARAKDARSEAFAWIKLVGVVGGSSGKPDEGLALIPAASAAVIRAGEPVDLRIDLLYAEGQILGMAGRLPDELAKLAAARKLLDEAHADDDPSSPFANKSIDVWEETGTAHAMSGEFDKAQSAYQKAIDLGRTLFGKDNLDEASAYSNLASAFIDDGKVDRALAAANEALRIRELRTGESTLTARTESKLGTIYGMQKKWDLAHKSYERALRIYRATLAPDDVQLADAILGVAWIDGELGDSDAELAGYAEVIALFARTKSSTPTLALAHSNRAEVYLKAKRYDEALKDYVRAIEVLEAHYARDSAYLITPLTSYGRCLVVAGKPAEAIVPLERVLTIDPTGGNETIALSAKGWLGKALIDSGRDRARGLAVAREARVALVAAAATDPSAKGELGDLDKWLSKHH